VRCQLFDRDGKLAVDNVYWQSQKDDDLGPRRNDSAMDLRQDSWADMTALNTMPPAAVDVGARRSEVGGESRVTIRVRNPSERVALFERATVSTARDGDEILPIEYDDNYITVFPSETAEIHAVLPKGAKPGWVRLEGYNTSVTSVPLP
jgi:exo-1,4-beta-D-glucosaminidase